MSEKAAANKSEALPPQLRWREGFLPPQQFKTETVLFAPLHPKDNEEDYQAWHENIDTIVATRGFDKDGSWPSAELTKEQNEGDLARHWKEFQDGTAFAYSVRDRKGRYIGCVYFYSSGKLLDQTPEVDVEINFWVTKEAYEENYYRLLKEAIEEFLSAGNGWAKQFKTVAFANKDLGHGK